MSASAILRTPRDHQPREEPAVVVANDGEMISTPTPSARSHMSSVTSTSIRGGPAAGGGGRSSMLMYGQRISLLGAVTSAVGALLAQEEAERRVLLTAFNGGNGLLTTTISSSSGVEGIGENEQQQHHHIISDATATTSSDEEIPANFIPFDPLRVQTNAVAVEEHEVRWELVHEEHALRSTMNLIHVETMYRLSANDRQRRTVARAVLEREATLRLVEIVCHWETQREALDARERAFRSATQQVVRDRWRIVVEEAEERDVTALSEDLLFRQELRAWQQQMMPDDEFD